MIDFSFVAGTNIGMMIDISTLLFFLIIFFLILFLFVNLLSSSTFSLVLLTLRSIRSSSLLSRSFTKPLGKARLGSLVPLVQLLLVLRLQHHCPDHLPASLVETLPVRIRPRVRPSLVLGEHPDSWRVLPGECLWVETPLGLGVEGGLSQEDGLLLGGNAELVVEGVVPDLLHVVPVGDDSVLDGVLQGKDPPLGLGLVTDVGVLLSHADHDTLVTGTSNDGGEDGPGGVVSGEAGLAHAGAIVADKRSNVLVTHLVL